MCSRCDLAVVNRDGEALMFYPYSGNLRQALAQLGRRTFEDTDGGGSRFVLVIGAVRFGQLKAMAARVPDTRYRYPGADVGEVAATQYGDGALRRHAFQRLGRSVDEGGGAGIGNDGGQRSVVVDKQHWFSRAQNTDDLTV